MNNAHKKSDSAGIQKRKKGERGLSLMVVLGFNLIVI